MTSTFAFEDTLPRLEVPTLEYTALELLKSLQPLVGAQEFSELIQESTLFINDPMVQLAQDHLVAASQNPNVDCYLDVVNDDLTPGIYGEPGAHVLPRNPYLVLEEDPWSLALTPPTQAQRSARLINSALKFIATLRNETLAPDRTPRSKAPLTMSPYLNLFGTTVAPHLDSRDHSRQMCIKRCSDYNLSRHIVIICNNQFYSLEVLTARTKIAPDTETHNLWFSDHDLSLVFQQIIDDSLKIDPIDAVNNSVGAITTQSYPNWKRARIELNRTSPDTLASIDNALLVLVLDPTNSPTTPQEKTASIAHGMSKLYQGTTIQVGSCTSRWYDKLQMVVTKNSVAGVVWESSTMDSTAILRFVSDVFTDLVLKLAKNINGQEYTLFDENVRLVPSKHITMLPRPQMLKFNKSPELQNLIHTSETRLADLINQHEYKVASIPLDSRFFKKLGISIDSLMQISLQITYYSLYGKMVSTLEPITTRKFRNARSELVPIQDDQVASLVKLFITDASAEEKWKDFVDCCKVHTEKYLNAMDGHGIQRHLAALVLVLTKSNSANRVNNLNTGLPAMKCAETDIPLLSNPILDKISLPELLISNCGNPALNLFGITPAIDQGMGIAYIIHPEKVIVTVSSKFRQTQRFLDTFIQVLREIKHMVKEQTNFLIEINDSEARKVEVQKLRIKQELEQVKHDSPSHRHPVKLLVDKGNGPKMPLEPLVSNKSIHSGTTENFNRGSLSNSGTVSDLNSAETMARKNSSGSEDGGEKFDMLGGYDYFDLEHVSLRSNLLSHNESVLNSHSTLASKLPSLANSRQHSYVSLYPFDHKIGSHKVK